jgi:hypothetical protein
VTWYLYEASAITRLIGILLGLRAYNAVVTAHASKRIRASAAFLWLALVIPAAGCGSRSTWPEDATTASDEVLRTLVGKQITISGKFSLRGKFGPFVLLSNEQMIYLLPKGSFTWGKTYSEMEGKLVTATGTLHFFHSPDSKSVNPAMARAADYFYFEAETAQIQLISH